MGGDGGGEQTIRYAAYIESSHGRALPQVEAAVAAAIGNNPFDQVTSVDLDAGFFSDGYDLSSFPSLWGMFGKFMAGINVHLLWQQTYNGILASPEINQAISGQAAYLDDDIDTNIYPRFHSGMRNINAVQSSAFAAGRALIEDTRIKAINKFSSELHIKALDMSANMWAQHLKWNESVIMTLAQMQKLYIAARIDWDAHKMNYGMKYSLWHLNLFEYWRAILGALNGAAATTEQGEASQTSKALSGAMGGAALGASVGGGYGAVVGGVIGLAASFL